MLRRSALVVFYSVFLLAAAAQNISLKKGQSLAGNSVVVSKSWVLPADSSLASPVLLIETDNTSIDFNQAVLNSGLDPAHPNQFQGLAILVRNCKNVSIRNLSVRGYKVAIRAENVSSLRLENCDLSYNYRELLASNQQREDIADWMSYHHNENNEWLRYGAAIYLDHCTAAIIRNCKVTGGQNALMMTHCEQGQIFNNNFSFNSGIGIGLYRSSNNRMLYNILAFNVRGYSDGVYSRGQDSAGILVYEQSSNNIFYRNNATHSGDGFFLWAGQSTMDSGKGGCNNNLLLSNDFSYAPTNGVEMTFSSNRVIDNRIYGCEHGLWGGYSYNSRISNNRFQNNHISIAIEQGQDIEIDNNLFRGDDQAIRLWARPEQPADWGYAQAKDVSSKNYTIALNSFNNNRVALYARNTTGIRLADNAFTRVPNEQDLDMSVRDLEEGTDPDLSQRYVEEPQPVVEDPESPIDPFAGWGKLAGRDHILVTEWGPYDYRYPIIWRTNPVDSGSQIRWKVPGPEGRWKVVRADGLEGLSRKRGKTGDSLYASKKPGSTVNLLLWYRGKQSITDRFGRQWPRKKKIYFSYSEPAQAINWSLSLFKVDSSDGREQRAKDPFQQVNEITNDLHYAWWGGVKDSDKIETEFLTIATGNLNQPAGEYLLRLSWDRKLRVFLDDSLVLDRWDPSEYDFNTTPHIDFPLTLTAGEHKLRVEQLGTGSFAVLAVRLEAIPAQKRRTIEK